MHLLRVKAKGKGGGARAGVVAAMLCAIVSAQASAQDVAKTLPAVVAVGAPAPRDAPASLDRVDADAAPARPAASVSELLRRIPGVAARDRQNLAQDVQVTIRGFGARTTFGVRGLRLYVDGIPASMPDGQGQVSHVPLAALESVEVLRGPFSALYGNASGGVVQFFSKLPSDTPSWGLDAMAGADATRRADAFLSAPWAQAGGGVRVDAGRFQSDGFRSHSRARRDLAQARLTLDAASGARVALTANAMDLAAQDPQGLTWAQYEADPRAASAGALRFDTRKTVRQRQAGLRYEQPLSSGALAVGAYGGARDTWQMLSIPEFAQSAPGSGGGLIDLDRGYSGLDARWRVTPGTIRGLSVTVGLEWMRSKEHRRGFENFVGDVAGVVGALRRDQHDRVASEDLYVEARWRPVAKWQATLGARHSRVRFRSDDHYLAPGNPDDSGARDYAFTTPVAGLSFQPMDSLDVYANAGRGFETPTASELAYRLDGGSGLNDALRPSRTDSLEAGMRWRPGRHRIGLAVFDSRTRDELVVARNEGGRSVYANAARTRRSGLELSASGTPSPRWRYGVAWTTLQARYGDTGARIPGTSARTGWAELRWSPRAAFDVPGTDLFLAASGNSRIAANDDNTAWAPGVARVDLGVERRWRVGGRRVSAWLRIDDAFDRGGIGSVIVNDGNGRYFEPAPGRTLQIGLRLATVEGTP